MARNNKIIIVQGSAITITKDEYISLTDMLKAKDRDFFISDWLRNRNTVEYLGIWERIHNPDFNYGEFATIRNQAGLNNYKISVKEWVPGKVRHCLTNCQASIRTWRSWEMVSDDSQVIKTDMEIWRLEIVTSKCGRNMWSQFVTTYVYGTHSGQTPASMEGWV